MRISLAERAQLESRAKRGDLDAQVYLDLLDLSSLAREIEIGGSVALPGATPTAIATITLPELPKGGVWYLANSGDLFAKLQTMGTAGNTTVELKDGSTVIVQWTLSNTDTDDTYKPADAASTASIPGGTKLTFSVTGIATGAVGPLSFKATFVPFIKRDDLFKVV